jgi:hypothetical protein
LHTVNNVLRNLAFQSQNLLNTNLSQGCRHDIVGKGEEVVCNSRGTRIFEGEGGNKDKGLASQVLLEVDGTLREETGLTGINSVHYESRTVFLKKTGSEGSVNIEIEFCRTKVDMRGIESAWSKETDRKGNPVAC